MHAQPEFTPFVRGVSRVALPGPRGVYLDSCATEVLHAHINYAQPRLLPSPPRPIAMPHPQSTIPAPCELHVAAIPIQTLEASHSYICCTYTTHAPSSPHPRTRISLHACVYPATPPSSSHKTKKDKHSTILASPPACASCGRTNGLHAMHAYMHVHQCRTKHAQLHVHFLCSVLTGQEFS